MKTSKNFEKLSMECFIPELEAMDQGCLLSSTGEAGEGERI